MSEIILIFIISLVGVLAGSDLAVKGLKGIGKALRVSDLFIGLTIASIGTSLPEIFTNINASLNGIPSIGVGNIIGSCLSQITLIVGLVSLFTDIKISGKILRREGLWLIIAIINMAIVVSDGIITHLEGFLLMIIYIIYLGLVIWDDKIKIKSNRSFKIHKDHKPQFFVSIAVTILGFGILILSSDFFVKSAAEMAEMLNVSKMLIGIFLVGVGTSLPELILATQSAIKGVKQISIGVLIGSNITDPLFSLGSGAIFNGVTAEITTLIFDIPVWTIFTVITLLMFYRSYKKHHTFKGIALIVLFILYAVVRVAVI